MPLIERKLGPGTTAAAGTEYTFVRDGFGRAVASVDNPTHARVFLAVEHFQQVDPLPAAAPSKPAPVDPPPPEPIGLGVPLPAEDPRTRNQLMAELREKGIEVIVRDTKETLLAKLATAG